METLPIDLVANLLAIAACLFAIWKCGLAERLAAFAVLANVAVGLAAHYFAPSLTTQIRLANDGLTALLLLGVTVRFAALWMGGVMLFYASQFSMHSFYLVTQRESDYFYALINNIDFAGILLCLIVGVVMSWRRRSRATRVRGEARAGPAT